MLSKLASTAAAFLVGEMAKRLLDASWAAPFLLLVGCATVVPPPQSATNRDVATAAVYTAINGKTQVFASGDWASMERYYPRRALRLEFEDDVLVRCSAASLCDVLQSAQPELTASAIDIAQTIAKRRRAYPFDVTVSFRVLSTGEWIVQWAPSLCPDRGFAAEQNARLERQIEITGSCILGGSPLPPWDAPAEAD